MEPLTLRAKDATDLLAIPEDDTLWFRLGEEQKQAHRATARAMVRDGVEAANKTFDLVPRVGFEGTTERAIRQTVDSYLDEWWLSIEQGERTKLRSAFQRFANGQTPGGFPGLVKDIEKLYDPVRARLIAETETTRLWSIGNEIAMDQAGVEVYEWRTANDSLVDDLCAALNETIHEIGGSGPRPPLHPRCRCAILPTEVKQEALP